MLKQLIQASSLLLFLSSAQPESHRRIERCDPALLKNVLFLLWVVIGDFNCVLKQETFGERAHLWTGKQG